jgi:hypothetical protein
MWQRLVVLFLDRNDGITQRHRNLRQCPQYRADEYLIPRQIRQSLNSVVVWHTIAVPPWSTSEKQSRPIVGTTTSH